MLVHRLFRSERTGAIIDDEWLKRHWPPYWHYDILLGLRIVAMVGGLHDERVSEALELLDAAQRPDGNWCTIGRRWWRRPDSSGSNIEVVEWGELADPDGEHFLTVPAELTRGKWDTMDLWGGDTPTPWRAVLGGHKAGTRKTTLARSTL